MTSLGAHLYEKHFAKLRLTKTPSDGSGYFEGLASTWDVDHDNERFAFGAWTASIFEWQKAASMPPIFLSHRSDQPAKIVGRITSMKETVDGLWVAGQLDLSSGLAQLVYESMLSGALDSMSVGFVRNREHKDENGVVVIDEAELLEVSLTDVPANEAAVVQFVKMRVPTSAIDLRAHLITAHGAPTTEVADMSVEALRAMHELKHARGADHEHRGLASELDLYKEMIDAAERSTGRTRVDPAEVDRFLTEVREEMVREKFAEAERANALLASTSATVNPVPVRVDARMRPDR